MQKQYDINEKGYGKGERIQFIGENEKHDESTDRFMNLTENKDTLGGLKTQ